MEEKRGRKRRNNDEVDGVWVPTYLNAMGLLEKKPR